MKLKGDWAALSVYDVDDVVRWENGDIFVLQNPCAAGITPIDTMYWGKILDPIASVISMQIDMLNSMNEMAGSMDTIAASIPTNIDDEGIVLKGADDAEYLITVDDSGETPELDVTLIVPEEAEGGET